MQTTKTPSRIHVGIIVVGVTAALIAQITSAAPCPPGYHGSYPHCMPDQAKPHPPYTAHGYAHASGATTMHAARTHPAEPKMADWHKTGPSVSPGPVEHATSASGQHGIIFVGGKQALNPQPIPPGKSSLNPQPIPPGHLKTPIPNPGAPIEKPLGH